MSRLAGRVAVVTGAVICLAVMMGADVLFDGYRPGGRLSIEFFRALWPGVQITAGSAWPGFGATLAISRWRGPRSFAFFAICGVLTANLAAVLFFGVVIREPDLLAAMLSETPAFHLGGLAGGLAYALFARRFRVLERPAATSTA